jgi:hypothetical protein
MAIFSEFLQEQLPLDCPPEETPTKTYSLPISREDAVDLVVTDVVGENDWYVYSTGDSPLPAGTVITSTRANESFDHVLSADTWFFFVDTQPFVPFSHEAYFVFVDVTTAEYRVTKEEYFPIIDGVYYFSTVDERLDASWRVYPDPSEGNLTYELSSEPLGTFMKLDYNAYAIANVPLGTPVPIPADECCKGVGKKYAIVVTGYDEPMFRGDTKNVYGYLKGQGFTDANINYFTAQAGEANSDGQTTLARVAGAFNNLSKKVECCDEVFIYISGHGSSHLYHQYKNKTSGKLSWFSNPGALPGGAAAWEATGVSKKFHKVTVNPKFTTPTPGGGTTTHGAEGGGRAWDTQWAVELGKLKSCYITVMYFSCFSGVAAPNLKGPGRTIITPVADNEAWGASRAWDGRIPGGYFTSNFIKAKTNASIKNEVDKNPKDGHVSDKEAFDWAKKVTHNDIKTRKNMSQDATWTPPEPCRCCHCICNESTDYFCVAVEPDGPDSEDCLFVGDYCGPIETITPPDDWVDPDDDDGVTVGGGEQPPEDEVMECGDGAITGTEQCDHGSTTTNKCPEGQYCRNCECKDLETSVVCGDGKISVPYEDCDGGDVNYKLCPEGQECRICKCVPVQTQCGDGSIGPGEQCDHGNTVTNRCDGGNVCHNCQCVPPGTIPPEDEPTHLACVNEACVVVSGYGTDQCQSNSDCEEELPDCGNEEIDPGEECEFDSDCLEGEYCFGCFCLEEEPECGDDYVEGWEECEFDEDCPQGEFCFGCLCFEEPAYCGDGNIDSGEECDPDATPNGCDSGGVCSAGCTCVYPPSLNCDEICSYTSGATNFGGSYSSAQACGAAVEAHYLPGRTCYTTCAYSWYYAVTNIAGTSSCCCGMKKEFACDDCPGQNPTCPPNPPTCENNAPSWYVPPS